MVFPFGVGRGTPWDGAAAGFSTSTPGTLPVSADLFGERDDESFGVAHVDQPEDVLMLRHVTYEVPAASDEHAEARTMSAEPSTNGARGAS